MPAKHVLDEAEPAVERPSRPKAVSHFTVGRARCAGKGGACRAAALRTRRVGSQRRVGEIRSICSRSKRRRVFLSSARSGTGGCWCPVRLLPRRRVSDGGRSRGWAAHGIARAALRRRASLEFRHLRRTGPEARLQHQRFRRDTAGTVRVGREAARRQPRGRGPGAWLRQAIRRAVVAAAAREYRETMAHFAQIRNIEVWYARLDVAAMRDQLGAASSPARR